MIDPFELLYLKVKVKKFKVAFKRTYHKEATIHDLAECLSNDDCPIGSCAGEDDVGECVGIEKNHINTNYNVEDAVTTSDTHRFGCIWCLLFLLATVTLVYKTLF